MPAPSLSTQWSPPRRWVKIKIRTWACHTIGRRTSFWATPRPKLSYAVPFRSMPNLWSSDPMAHPQCAQRTLTELRHTLSELRCTLAELRSTLYAIPRPFWTLRRILSYAAPCLSNSLPIWARPHPIWATQHPMLTVVYHFSARHWK